MESNKGRGSLTSRYLAALLAPAVIAGVMQVTWPFFQNNPVLPYLLAVIFCAWYGGLGPGLLSVVSSLLLTDFFFVEPYFFFWFPNQADLVRLLLFAIVGPFISVMSELMHREKRRAGINLESAKRAAAMELIGYSSGSYAGGTNFREILAPEVRDQFDDYLKRIRADGVASGLMLVQTKTGEKQIWEYHNTLRTQGVSAPIVRGVARDITERRRANQSLKLFRNLIDRSSDAIEVIDPTTLRFLDCNESAYQTLGYSREEFLSLSVFDIDPLADRSMMMRLDEEMEKSGFATLESIHRRKDGSTFPVEINLKVVRLERDYRLAVVRDITERKRAEDALRESEDRYRDLFEHSQNLICIHDLQGQILSANPAFARLVDSSVSDGIIKMNLREILAPEARDQFDVYIAAIRRDGSASGLASIQTVSGEQRILEYNNTLRTDGVANPVVRGIAHDITERKRAAALLAGEKRALEMIASGRQLPDILDALTRIIEKQSKGLSCSILLLDADGAHLRHGAAPSLPDAYCRAIDGVSIGPSAGSCGTAAFRKELVVVEDVATDPLWEDYRELALEHGLRACWSTPILTADGSVLGTFAMYYRESRRPEPTDLELIERATQLAAIAIERRQAEKALRQSEHRYRDIFTFAPVGIYQSLRNGTLITANKALAEMLAYDSVDEFLKGNLADVYFTPDEREKLIREYEDRGYSTDLELRWKRKDGVPIWVQLTTHAIKGANGVTEYWEGFVRDITERKRAEEALRESEQNLAEAQRIARIGSWRWDFESNQVQWSDEMHRLFEVDKATFDGSIEMIVARAIHPDDQARVQQATEQALAEHKPTPLEYRILLPDGTERAVWAEGVIIFDETGRAIGMNGTVQDITARKQAEAALRESIERFELVARATSDAVWDWDIVNNKAWWNDTFYTAFGYPPDTVPSLEAWVAKIHPEDRERVTADFLEVVEQGRESWSTEYRFQLADGTYGHFSDRAFAVQNAEGKTIRMLGAMLDLSEHKRAEEALRESEERLRLALDAAQMGTFDWDVPRNRITWSRWHEEMWGFKPGEFGGTYEAFSERVHPDDLPGINAEVARCIAAREPFAREFRVVWPDGSVHWVQGRGEFTFGDDGQPVRMRGAAVETTARMLAQEALRTSEEKYRTILENIEDGYYEVDLKGNLTFFNEALCAIFGYPHEELMGMNYRQYTDPEAVPRVYQTFNDVYRTGESSDEYGYRVIRKDGAARFVAASVTLIRDEAGQPAGFRGIVRDITERKQAEEALKHSEERYRTIIEDMTDAYIETDLAGRFTFFNNQAAIGQRRSREQLMGLSNKQYMDEETVKRVGQVYKQVYLTGEPVKGLNFEMTRGDGTSYYVEMNVALLRDSQGKPVGFRGVSRDVTERKQIEEALRESEERYRELFENANDAIYVYDLSGKYTSVNRAAEKLSGYLREEIIGKNFTSFIAPEYLRDVRKNSYKKLHQGGETFYEAEVIARQGHRVPVDISSRLIYENGVPVGIQGTARDITERKRAEAALRNYSRLLIKAQEAERQHIARELHDQIGQVLTAVRINLQTIGNSYETAESRSLTDEGMTLVDDALDQVRDLSFELRPSLLDDLGLTAALRWYTDRYAQRTGIQTKTSICPKSRIRLPRELETACFRIVQEALTNVARHAQAKNVSIDVRTMKGSLSLSIKDDGIGFNSHSLTNSVSLSSLGLRGMEERAHGLGGKLEIKSAPHEGTEVRVHFPNGTNRKELT